MKMNIHLRKRDYLRYFLLCFLLLIQGAIYSQEKFFSIKYGVNNGLLSNDNYRVYQDHDGYIWILSEKGITKFNGFDFSYFTTAQGLNTNDVWDMGIDSHNRKWLKSFSNGIQYIQNDSVTTVKGSEKYGQLVYVGEHRDTVFFIQYDQNRNIKSRFFFTENGVFGECKKKHNNYQLIFDYSEYGLQYYRSQEQKIGVFVNGNFKSEYKAFALFSFNGSAPNENLPIVSVLTGTERGIGYFTNGKLEIFPISKVTDSPVLNAFYDLTNKRTIVQTSDRFFVFKTIQPLKRDYELEKRLNQNSELKSFAISNITIDSEQNLWVVKHRGEVFFYPNNNFSYLKLLSKNNEQIGNTVVQSNYNSDAFFVDRPNQLYKIVSNMIHKVNLTVTIPSIRQFEFYKNKLLFISDYYLIEHDLQTSRSKVLHKTHDRFFSFAFINEDQLLFSNGEIFDLKSKRVVSKINLPNKATSILYLDTNVIFHYENKIHLFNLDTKTISEIPLQNIQGIKRINNQLFAITSKELYVVNTHYLGTKKIHTSSHEIRNISFQNGKINLITDRYLVFADFDFKKFTITKLHYIDLKPYGLQVNDIKWKGNSSAYLFTTEGVFLVENLNQINNLLSVPFKLTSNKNDLKSTIYLNSKTSKLIDIKPIAYASFGEVIYRYRISKVETNAPYTYTNDGKILLTNLTQGEYILYVESAPNSFSKYGNGHTVKVIVKPLFSETILFKVSITLIILISFVLVILITKRLVSIRNKRNLRIKELELNALRAQLNPHFVFNVLNSIQGVMLYQNKEQANEYIYSFSELIRTVLDNSRESKVALSEEIRLIENYLKLENMRLNNTLNYVVEYRSLTNPESIPIHSMIIQPFVENSIVHGFKTNQTDKQLKVIIDEKDNFLLITIEDNGIGRKKAAELKRAGGHKSWASTILQEKSNLLNSIDKNELKIDIFDLENDNSTGTKVIIRMKTC